MKLESGLEEGRTTRDKRFSEEQIIAILRDQEAGEKTANVCRKHEITNTAFYRWQGEV